MRVKYPVDTHLSSSAQAQAWLDLRWAKIDQAVDQAARIEDWDPISPTVVAAAKNLIARFAYAIGVPAAQNEIPHISSDGEGGITFEWWKGSRSLTLFTRADGSNGLLLAWGPDIQEEMESVEEPTDAEIKAYWLRLNQR